VTIMNQKQNPKRKAKQDGDENENGEVCKNCGIGTFHAELDESGYHAHRTDYTALSGCELAQALNERDYLRLQNEHLKGRLLAKYDIPDIRRIMTNYVKFCVNAEELIDWLCGERGGTPGLSNTTVIPFELLATRQYDKARVFSLSKAHRRKPDIRSQIFLRELEALQVKKRDYILSQIIENLSDTIEPSEMPIKPARSKAAQSLGSLDLKQQSVTVAFLEGLSSTLSSLAERGIELILENQIALFKIAMNDDFDWFIELVRKARHDMANAVSWDLAPDDME
jgi:hypothetical protein